MPWAATQAAAGVFAGEHADARIFKQRIQLGEAFFSVIAHASVGALRLPGENPARLSGSKLKELMDQTDHRVEVETQLAIRWCLSLTPAERLDLLQCRIRTMLALSEMTGIDFDHSTARY